MTFRSVYLISLTIVTFSYSLLIFANYFPNWIEVTSINQQHQFYKRDYGLFFVCNSLSPINLNPNPYPLLPSLQNSHSSFNITTPSLDTIDNPFPSNGAPLHFCIRFPNPHSEICNTHSGLCEIWEMAGSFSIFSLFVGAWCLALVSEIVLGGSSHRSRGWAFLFVFLALFGLAKFFLLIIVYRLEVNPVLPFKPIEASQWWEIKVGRSFHLAWVSLLFDLLAMSFLFITHRTLRPAYQEIP